MNMLELSHVSKRFGSKQVLQDVTLAVPQGCIFGFIGRNGAGKTTSIKAILGLLAIDGGEITVCGERVAYGHHAANRHIGYLPDVPEFYSYMTAAEYLKLCGEIGGMKPSDIKSRTAELLELVGLAGETHRIKGYSRGMKQRLGIAQALLNRPKLLICDEPTSALDPLGRREILDILLAARQQTAVFFSTHILSDIEKTCDHAAFLEGGRILLSGTIEEIKQLHSRSGIEVVPQHAGDLLRLRDAFPQAEVQGERLLLNHAADEQAEQMLQYIVTQRIPLRRFQRQEPDLETLYLEVIGQ